MRKKSLKDTCEIMFKVDLSNGQTMSFFIESEDLEDLLNKIKEKIWIKEKDIDGEIYEWIKDEKENIYLYPFKGIIQVISIVSIYQIPNWANNKLKNLMSEQIISAGNNKIN